MKVLVGRGRRYRVNRVKGIRKSTLSDRSPRLRSKKSTMKILFDCVARMITMMSHIIQAWMGLPVHKIRHGFLFKDRKESKNTYICLTNF